jgi:hypothetical protein
MSSIEISRHGTMLQSCFAGRPIQHRNEEAANNHQSGFLRRMINFIIDLFSERPSSEAHREENNQLDRKGQQVIYMVAMNLPDEMPQNGQAVNLYDNQVALVSNGMGTLSLYLKSPQDRVSFSSEQQHGPAQIDYFSSPDTGLVTDSYDEELSLQIIGVYDSSQYQAARLNFYNGALRTLSDNNQIANIENKIGDIISKHSEIIRQIPLDRMPSIINRMIDNKCNKNVLKKLVNTYFYNLLLGGDETNMCKYMIDETINGNKNFWLDRSKWSSIKSKYQEAALQSTQMIVESTDMLLSDAWNFVKLLEKTLGLSEAAEAAEAAKSEQSEFNADMLTSLTETYFRKNNQVQQHFQKICENYPASNSNMNTMLAKLAGYLDLETGYLQCILTTITIALKVSQSAYPKGYVVITI